MGDPRRLADQLSELGGQWNIVEHTVTLPSFAPILLVAHASPLRYAIIFSIATGGSSGYISLTTVPGNPVGTGLFLGPNGGVLALTYRDYGGLVQVPWYGSSPTFGLELEIIEILMVQ